MHAITLVTAAGTALAWCGAPVVADRSPSRRGRSATTAPRSRRDRERFLGLFGLAVGAISLLLIVWEGSYVLVIDACRPL